jgi:cyclophilin family peptidyl-prolyl cis-trans isomerase
MKYLLSLLIIGNLCLANAQTNTDTLKRKNQAIKFKHKPVKSKDPNSVKIKKHPKFDYVFVIRTSFGEIQGVLFDETPIHHENFIKLANTGFFDSTTFHRIIPNFMIQGGDPNSKDSDPTNDGQGGPGYTLKAEILSQFKHVRGALAAARMGDQVNPNKESSGSQFFIVQNHKGTPFLDGNYTVFGEVFDNLEIVDKLVEQPRDGMDRPLQNIIMTVRCYPVKRKEIERLYGYKFHKLDPEKKK